MANELLRSGKDIAQQIDVEDVEFVKTHRRLIVDAFRGVLNREPDLEALESYLQQVMSGQVSFENLLRYFCSLDEFYLRAQPKNRKCATELLYAAGAEVTGDAFFWNETPENLVNFHFPKTGGVSFTTMMATFFHPLQLGQAGPRKVVNGFNFGHYQKLFAYHMGWTEAQAVPGPKVVLTCLREPTSRLLSLISFLGALGEKVAPPFDRLARLCACGSLMDVVQSQDPAVRNHIDNVYVRHLTGAYIQEDGVDPLKENPEKFLRLALDRIFGMTAFYFLEDVVRNGGRLEGTALSVLQRFGGETFDGKLPQTNASSERINLEDLNVIEQDAVRATVALDQNLYRIAYEARK